MYRTVVDALGLVDAWTRRRTAVSGLLALGLALLEMLGFGLLYGLLTAVSSESRQLPRAMDVVLRHLGADDRSAEIRLLASAAIIVLLTKSLAAMAVSRWQARVSSMSDARLSTQLFKDYLGEDFLFHVSHNSATLMRNLTGSINYVTSAVIGSLSALMTEGLVLLGTLAVLALASPGLAAGLAVFSIIVLTGYTLAIGPVVHRAASRDLQLTGLTTQAMQEGFSGIKSVHAFNVSEPVHANFTELRGELAASRATLTFAQRLPQYYLEVCLVVGVTGAISIMYAAFGRDRAVTLLGLLVVAALRVLPSVTRILGSLSAIRNGAPAVRLLMDERTRRASTDDQEHALQVVPEPTSLEPLGSLRLTDVSFSYPGRDQPVLESLSLHVPPGSFVGIVGPSGSGKTTLVDLILGLLRPSQGSIVVNGLALSPRNVAAWRSRLGYVPQETYLLDGSLRENVLFHRELAPEAGDAPLWEALATAQLDEVVRQLPDGLDTQVGERGVRLSGGQRQRLGLARALLGRPSVLVLDEATSALDGGTEAAVSQTIARLRGELTLIVIAHRLSTLKDCDSLVLLEGGRIVGTGSFRELAASSSSFAATLTHALVDLDRASASAREQ